MRSRYAGDFDPATLVVELCQYSSAIEENKRLESRVAELDREIISLKEELAASGIDFGYKCIACRHQYNIEAGKNEDCPKCGCNGTV